MSKKKSDESAPPMKGNPSGKDSSKEWEAFCLCYAGMDQKGSSSSRAKAAPKKTSSYTDIDLPPSDDEEQRQAEAKRKLEREQRHFYISCDW